MSHPSNHNNSKEEDIRQEDLLDVVEDLEKRRRRLLISVTESFITWGKLVGRSKKLIEEMKRRKFIQDTHEAEEP